MHLIRHIEGNIQEINEDLGVSLAAVGLTAAILYLLRDKSYKGYDAVFLEHSKDVKRAILSASEYLGENHTDNNLNSMLTIFSEMIKVASSKKISSLQIKRTRSAAIKVLMYMSSLKLNSQIYDVSSAEFKKISNNIKHLQ